MLIRVTGDWSLAEDSTQDAFAKALARWPREGVPDSPGAWLTTVARNAALDRLRRRANEERKLRDRLVLDDLDSPAVPDVASLVGRSWDEDADDRVRLVFTCAHPALSLEARVALTLHTVGGLSTREIAHAFLIPEATMAQRLVRAKRRLRGAGIPYRVPSEDELPARLDGVLAVLYLIYTEGHSASSGDDAMRVDLATEAVRLLRLVLGLVPEASADEARALLALLLLQHSRHRARIDADGIPVPFDEQDRTLWDADALAEAAALLRAPHRVRGGYRVQAELAAAHALSPDSASTDWPRIVVLYDELAGFTRSPAADASRALALGFAEGWDRGLAEVARLEALPSPDQRLLAATRAELLRRSGDPAAAADAYRDAHRFARTTAERSFFARRLAELDATM